MRIYKEHIPPSAPEEEWDARNILYSLPFNIANALYVPNSTQKPIVYEDMTCLCKMYCPEKLGEDLITPTDMDVSNRSSTSQKLPPAQRDDVDSRLTCQDT